MERVLVCMLGSIRASELTWPSFKLHVLDQFEADLALCIGRSPVRTPYHHYAKYVWEYEERKDWGKAYDSAKEIMYSSQDWRQLLDVKYQWLGGILDKEKQQPGSGAISLYFRWLLRLNLELNELWDKYDRIIITRSDYYYMCPHPPLYLLNPDNVWIPQGEECGGVTDRHTVLTPGNAKVLLSFTEDMIMEPEELRRAMINKTDWNIEQFLNFQMIRCGMRDSVKFFPLAMFLVRGEHDSTRWAEGLYMPGESMKVKYRAEYELAQQMKGKITKPEQWANYIKP